MTDYGDEEATWRLPRSVADEAHDAAIGSGATEGAAAGP